MHFVGQGGNFFGPFPFLLRRSLGAAGFFFRFGRFVMNVIRHCQRPFPAAAKSARRFISSLTSAKEVFLFFP